LRWAWKGDRAFHRAYPSVKKEDIPFGQDCVGDQFLLRQDSVLKLFTETGDIEDLKMTLIEFLEAVQGDPNAFLGLAPLTQFHQEGGTLQPGELLNTYPPYCTKEASEGVSLAAVPAKERLRYLAELSKCLQAVPQDGHIQIDIKSKSGRKNLTKG
jgi:hypothetical protein